MQEGPKKALPDGTHYEYDPILKRTVEVTLSGERFPVTLVDGELQRDSERPIGGRGRLPRMRYNYKGFRGCDSCCDIQEHRRSDGKYVFIATEVPE